MESVKRSALGADLLLLLTLCGCTAKEDDRQRAAQEYLQSGSDVNKGVRAAILDGKIILGMFPDEAYHAGGSFTYEVLGAPTGVPPADVLWSQRERPDPNITIRMCFRNRTQYGGDSVIPFAVTFKNGRAVAIDESKEEVERTAEIDATYRQAALKAVQATGRLPREEAGADGARRIDALATILREYGRYGPPQDLVLEGAAIALGEQGLQAVPTLIDLLREQQYWTRGAACIALKIMGPGGSGAVPALCELLKSDDAEDVKNACDALGAIGPLAVGAVSDVVPLLENTDVYVRVHAARALGGIGPGAKAAVSALKRELNNDEEEMRAAAKAALDKIDGSR